jgi:hypothetical protein
LTQAASSTATLPSCFPCHGSSLAPTLALLARAVVAVAVDVAVDVVVDVVAGVVVGVTAGVVGGVVGGGAVAGVAVAVGAALEAVAHQEAEVSSHMRARAPHCFSPRWSLQRSCWLY